jgi:hypothetical protein
MSDESEIEKVLASADKLKYLGRNRAFFALIFALWAARRKGGLWSALAKLGLVTAGVGGYGYWNGFFS